MRTERLTPALLVLLDDSARAPAGTADSAGLAELAIVREEGMVLCGTNVEPCSILDLMSSMIDEKRLPPACLPRAAFVVSESFVSLTVRAPVLLAERAVFFAGGTSTRSS